jgi:hypothetical protein
MRKLILAAAALLSLGAGSAYAATNYQNGYAQTNAGAATGTAVNATQSYSPVYIGPEANPWNGTESWTQWNADHPQVGGGEG